MAQEKEIIRSIAELEKLVPLIAPLDALHS
jgi:hypothetical protein